MLYIKAQWRIVRGQTHPIKHLRGQATLQIVFNHLHQKSASHISQIRKLCYAWAIMLITFTEKVYVRYMADMAFSSGQTFDISESVEFHQQLTLSFRLPTGIERERKTEQSSDHLSSMFKLLAIKQGGLKLRKHLSQNHRCCKQIMIENVEVKVFRKTICSVQTVLN